jgi:glucokinase
LEALTAGPGIARAAGRKYRDGQAVAEAARRGDARARKIFRDAGVQLGLAVANLISLFDPEVVVIGGGMAGAADLYLADLRRVALQRCQPLNARRVKIVTSKLGGDANLLGMAALVMKKGKRR